MPKSSCCTLLSVCLCSLSLAYAADTAHFPSSEELRHVRSVSQPRVSPDGHSVLVQIADATADGGKSHIWLVDVQQNTARQLTFTPSGEKRGESGAAWMPDGNSVLFMAHRGEHTQLFRLPMNGGEAHPFAVKIVPPVDQSKETDAIPPADKSAARPATPAKPEPVDCDVERYFVSPDGRTIAILVHDPQTSGEKKEQDDKADAVWVDHDPHGSRLYLLDPGSGKITPTAVPPDVAGVSWAHAGDKLLALSDGMNDIGDLAPATTSWVLAVADPAHPSQLKALPATIEAAEWTKDDAHIVYLAQSQTDAPPGYSDLYQFTVSDSSNRDLTADFSGSIDGAPIAVSDAVLAPVQIGMHTTVLRFSGDHRDPLSFPTATVSQLSTNEKQSAWVWLGSSGNQFPALYYSEKLGQPAKTLKTVDLTPAAWTATAPQLVSWKSDSFTVEGLLYLPPQAADQKVPLIVDVHGGPTGGFEDSWNAFTEFLLGHGWAILRTNPRGSTGYGAAFAAANKNDMGGGDYRDIMAGIDLVLAKYPIDSSKLALMGYSYGGEMAAFVEGRTDRFKAIISGAPVIDQESEYGTESDSWYDRWFYGGYPWEHPESAWKQSPLADAAKAKTPFLLLQGEGDTTDPLGQSQEMFRALRQMGVPVEMVQYPRENHGPLAGGIFGAPSPEPWHGFDGRQRIVNFLMKAFGE
ncbi:MAG TPA: prolyl oligopeptidase family serine peptidase [Acidobacteriaceae bacterium]|jgi:dipeptidyl aminopeptidase/acylaminoacyl peptidase|nr:prolyl oligopeptidase family serine peptidase [Acidobacteriaceae bacterium]